MGALRVGGGAGSILEISVPSAQFYCEHKTALKKIVNNKRADYKIAYTV